MYNSTLILYIISHIRLGVRFLLPETGHNLLASKPGTYKKHNGSRPSQMEEALTFFEQHTVCIPQ